MAAQRPAEILCVRVKPGSKEPGIAVEDGIVTLRVRERAIDGAANAACIRALAKALGLPRSGVTLVRGVRSREKSFALAGFTPGEARKRLGPSS